MKNKLVHMIFIACSIMSYSKHTIASPTIPNPSFELLGYDSSDDFIILGNGSTQIDGWVIGNQGVDYFKESKLVSDGSYSVNYIRGPGEGGSIITTISDLIVGTKYDLSFDVIQTNPSVNNALTVTVGSDSKTYINTVSEVWQRQHFIFTATNSTAALMFSGPEFDAADTPSAHVDNVAITSTIVKGSVTWTKPPYSIKCVNNTTSKSIIIRKNKKPSYDCEKAGLVVNSGDNISVTITGNKY